MQIVITGRHLGVTEPMKDYAREKAGKLGKIHDRLSKIEVVMDVAPHGGHTAEMVADYHRSRLVGKAEHLDMYAAIDLAEDKVLRQLVKVRQRLTDHHRGESSMSGVSSETAGAFDGTATPTPPDSGSRLEDEDGSTDAEAR
jgi:putative sigma-54 modulation protein